jgi:TPP-dependent pyruvate/acetoin dehydrogenase alpha subunit
MTDWKKTIETAVLIRQFEERIQKVYHTDCIQSPVHLSIGQELACALIADNYIPGDYAIGNYRSHGLALALAADYRPLVLELMAKKGGTSGGKAGSMHLSVPENNMMWTSAIVGSGVPVSLGIADALKRSSSSNIACVLFGDGAIEEGCVLESLNIASLMSLPIIFILENNGLAIHSRKEARSSVADYLSLPASFGISTYQSSYRDPIGLSSQFNAAFSYVREVRQPAFLVVDCFRWVEHVGVAFDWDLGYRKPVELQDWQKYDVIQNPSLVAVDTDYVHSLEKKYNDLFQVMFEECLLEPDPLQSDLLSNVI